MRLDDFLSTVGAVKRRAVARELARRGLVTVNGRNAKPAARVNVNDIVHIKGTRAVTLEVLAIPSGSVPKNEREKYIRTLNGQ